MATGNSVQNFAIDDVSEGCNYSDDITALKKNQSPDSMNVEYFNGRIIKRSGEAAFTTPPSGQGGIDAYTKLLLHADGTAASTTFTDSELTPKAVTANGNAQLSTTQLKFGTASGIFGGNGIDSSTVLMLHMDGIDGSTTFTDSEITPKVVSVFGSTHIVTAQSKFGGASGLFNGTTDYLTLPTSTDWAFGTGDFTIDFWMKVSVAPIVGTSLLIHRGNVSYDELSISMDTGGIISFLAQSASANLAAYSTPSSTITDTNWHHIAFVRNGSNFFIFVDGVSKTLTINTPIGSNNLVDNVGDVLTIGRRGNSANFYYAGYFDELRISKGIARWVTGFVPPLLAYSTGDYLSLADSTDWAFGTGDFTIDFWVYINNFNIAGTNVVFSQDDGAGTNKAIFAILSDGSLTVEAVSSSVTQAQYSTATGLVSTGVFTHIAFVRNGSNFYIFVNGASITLTTLTAISANTWPDIAQPLEIGRRSSSSGSAYTNGFLDEMRVSKGIARWTASFTPPALPYDTYNAAISPVGFSVIDFSDTNDYHRQVAHLGNVVYAYDRVSSSSVILRNGAPRVRSFNAKIGAYLIQTYNDFSAPYYWDGSTASMAIVSGNAPGIKRAIEFQGYLIGMNTAANPTRCYYQPIGNILGGGAAYTDYFTLTPAPNDDETSDPFLLNGRLYIGTKYSIFRVSFVGGVTVFEFKQVISDVGIVPGTAQTVVTKEYGQVVLFLGTDKRIYMFDGANVKTISDLFYYHNDSTPIALDLIDDNYKENSFAVFDFTKRIYRLFVTKKASSMNYYCMNVDVDTFAYYPFDNMEFSSGYMCYDALLRPFLICSDYSGALHKMYIDTPTDNGTPINEYYTSPLVSIKSTAIKKGSMITFQNTPVSNANLLVYDKVDYRRVWEYRQKIPLFASRDKFLGVSFVLGSSVLGSEKDVLLQQLGANITFNTYQFKLVSDTPTAVAWEIFNIEFDQSMVKYGKAEAQR